PGRRQIRNSATNTSKFRRCALLLEFVLLVAACVTVVAPLAAGGPAVTLTPAALSLSALWCVPNAHRGSFFHFIRGGAKPGAAPPRRGPPASTPRMTSYPRSASGRPGGRAAAWGRGSRWRTAGAAPRGLSWQAAGGHDRRASRA